MSSDPTVPGTMLPGAAMDKEAMRAAMRAVRKPASAPENIAYTVLATTMVGALLTLTLANTGVPVWVLWASTPMLAAAVVAAVVSRLRWRRWRVAPPPTVQQIGFLATTMIWQLVPVFALTAALIPVVVAALSLPGGGWLALLLTGCLLVVWITGGVYSGRLMQWYRDETSRVSTSVNAMLTEMDPGAGS